VAISIEHVNDYTVHPDAIRDSIQIRIVAANSIRDSNKNFRFAGP